MMYDEVMRSSMVDGNSVAFSVTEEEYDGLEFVSVADDLIAGSSVVLSDFVISGYEIGFVAGIGNLSWSNFKSGYDGYYYQSSLVVDSEKCTGTSMDDQMCWAATAANMLYYAGWQIDTGDEDDVFSVFMDEFLYGDLYVW